MSDVNANDTALIENADDVLPLYQGVGDAAKIGAEVELAFFDPATPDLKPMSADQNKSLKSITSAAIGNFVNNEPTTETLEIATIAEPFSDLRAVMDDTDTKIKIMTEKAASLGLKRSYFQELPERNAKDLLTRIMPVARYQAFFVPPRADMQGFAEYFSVCKSNQISVSYHNPDHMLENVRRLYYLAPFLFMMSDNTAAFHQGKPSDKHPGMALRATLGDRGVFYPYLFTAQNGQEYINAHINHVMNNPLFVYYDQKGDMIKLPAGEWTSLNKLRDQGLNTATNYWFSQTVLWPDVKIAALKDARENVTGHRYEARMFGVGAHQHQTALLIVGALGFKPNFAANIDGLLNDFGFDKDRPEETKKTLEAAYHNAIHHNGQFFDIKYGNGSMRDFAIAFANLLETAYLGTEFEEDIIPILRICRTGLTDTKINTALFDTLDKIRDFQRTYDPALMSNPRRSMCMVFESGTDDNAITDCAQSRPCA